jgi:uncharacterized protein
MDSKVFGKDIKDIPSCGDLDLRIARDGTWYYKNSPIQRKPLVRLFASVLHKDGDGVYWLVTPVERCKVEVEDAPFLAVELRVEGEGEQTTYDFRTNVEEWVPLGPKHPLLISNGIPYIALDKNLTAKIDRALYYHLVERAAIDMDQLVLWSRGQKYSLGDWRETI